MSNIFFSLCSIWIEVICHLNEKYHFFPPQQCDNLHNFLRIWTHRFSKYSVCCYLIFFAMWIIWKARNSFIFEGKKLTILNIIFQIEKLSQLYQPPCRKAKNPRALGSGPSLAYPCGFFDGAFAKNIGGVDIYLYLNMSHSFEFALGAGTCTNTKA